MISHKNVKNEDEKAKSRSKPGSVLKSPNLSKNSLTISEQKLAILIQFIQRIKILR